MLLMAVIGCQMAPVDTAQPPDDPAHSEPQDGASSELPELSIGDASLAAGTGGANMRFGVRLAPESASAVTVQYQTQDGTAKADVDYTAANGALTFAAGATAETIEVALLNTAGDQEPKTFTVTLSNPSGARLSGAGASAIGTINAPDGGPVATGPGGPTEPPTTGNTDPGNTDPPELSSLAVTGAGTLYPAFAAGTLHYALTCDGSPTLTVAAETGRAGARITLLRADSANNVVSDTGSLGGASVEEVGGDHDLAIEVGDDNGSTTYVVHCLPASFPTISTTRTSQVKDGLLLVTPTYGGYSDRVTFMAVLDNNGVPRFHRQLTTSSSSDNQFWAMDFKYHGGGRFSVARREQYNLDDSPFGNWRIELLNERLEVTSTVTTVSPLSHTDGHDFHVAPNGDYVMLSYYDDAPRDFSLYGGSAIEEVADSVIQRRSAGGASLLTWNTWDHRDVLQWGNDCTVGMFLPGTFQGPPAYAHLNAVQLLADGDFVASSRGCAQVLRIDGSTGAVEWKLGGTAPGAGATAEFLELVEHPDPDVVEEFCGQHHVTLTSSNTVVMYDNGVQCLGSRKALARFSRAVEYDVSSGTQAELLREVKLPDAQGYFPYRGGVHVLETFGGSVHWLISWGGNPEGESVALDEQIVVSEVDPATGTAHLELNMYAGSSEVWTYRAYRIPESAVDIARNLP
ncbi:MAG: aryl-sulfate sulfotransferase [Spirochaetaceae bacterium]|nr:aryl-sulfate sulfotransferase [Spirochaetaceae bacterium]